MSRDEESMDPGKASSIDVRHNTEQDDARSDIQGDDEIPLIHRPPSELHIWDGASYEWVHQRDYPEEERPQRWRIYKTIVDLCPGPNTVIIPAEYRQEDDAFAAKYGDDEITPDTPVVGDIPSAPHASAGTMFSAQLRQTNTPGPRQQAEAMKLVQGDLSRLTSMETLSSTDLNMTYKQTLVSLFRNNLTTLSHDLVASTLNRARNDTNREILLQWWHSDWSSFYNQDQDDRLIREHAQHPNLSRKEIETFARIMHKYCVTGKGENAPTRQLTSDALTNRQKIATFAQTCIRLDIPMLLRDTFVIEANALQNIQSKAQVQTHFQLATRRDARPAHKNPTTWPNDRYLEYFLELFPDKTSGATANQANADNAAQKAARDFCHTMEKTYVTNVDDVADTVSNALRAKLQVTYPYGLIVDRTEATNVVHAAVQEFRRMAQEPAKFKNAADYVNTWENDKPPTTLIEIEKHFMTRLTKLAIDIHNVQEYFRGTKIGVFIGEEYAPSTSSTSSQSNRLTGHKRSQPPGGQPSTSGKHSKVANTTKQCPTCGNFHHRDAKKPLADGKCQFVVHPDANIDFHPTGIRIPWTESTQGKRYAASSKTCLVWGKDLNDNAVEMSETNLPQGSVPPAPTPTPMAGSLNHFPAERHPSNRGGLASRQTTPGRGNFGSSRGHGGRRGRGKSPPHMPQVYSQQLLSSIDNTENIPITFPATVTNLQRRAPTPEGPRPRKGRTDGIGDTSPKNDSYKLKSCLSDTGAISSDYISLQLVHKLIKKYDNVIISQTNIHVRSPFKNAKPINCLGRVQLPLTIFNELTNVEETIEIDALIIDSEYEVIIGRPTIRKYGLLVKCHNQILFGTREAMVVDDTITTDRYKLADRWILNHLVNAAYDVIDIKGNSREYPFADNTIKPPTQRRCVGCDTTRKIHSVEGTTRKIEATTEQDNNSLPYVCSECYSPNLTLEAKLQEINEVGDEQLYQVETQLSALEENPHNQHWQAAGALDKPDAVFEQTLNSWHQSLAAIGSETRRTENPVVVPLPDVQPHDIIPKERLFTSIEDDGMTPNGDDTETFTYSNETDSAKAFENDEYKNVKLSGSDLLKEKVGALVKEFRDIFSTSLPADPARVTPLSFTIAREQWYTPANRCTYRRQSILKDQEIGLQIEVMDEAGVITRSNATHWSQVLLTPKPNLKWRFCIDFRKLNETMRNKGWPLPRIQEVIQRIGAQRSSIFGKMDLTSGYHQAPLSAECRALTAFITSHGLFEWTRVPMGLKNAAAYFQEIMCSEVLNGLVNHILEIYIDDVVTHAATEGEFVKRLRLIFERFRKFNIKLSPNKCEFGMSEIEILGHKITKDGVHFSGKKLQGVNDVKLPQTGTQLHSFLGLANYFRDHVKDVHQLEKPLRGLLKQYPKSQKIKWLPHLEEAFYNLKDAVWQCPTLFFIDYNAPVFLHTDACNTGIGAYLFQVIDDKEHPIGFMSTSLIGAQLNWSTFEQEGYAIHQALKKFEYILRDVKFTLRTDHRNLLYVNDKASPKVLRWKIDIQQFNFDVEHIPGPDNIVADLYSRLSALQTVTKGTQEWTDTWREVSEPYNDQRYPSRELAMLTLAAGKNVQGPPSAATPHWAPSEAERHDRIAAVHNSTYGHGGVERTISLLNRGTTWPNMRTDVRKFIRQCPCCQIMTKVKLKIHLAPYNVSQLFPMDRVNIDTVGPLSTDLDGYSYIIVVIDVFSRFVELYKCKDTAAATAARAIFEHTGRYGTPAEILTDNGTQYIADMTEQLCRLIDTNHTTILPYSHEENSIVERANKEVMRHIRAIIYDRQLKNKWSSILPLVQRIMNASKNATTGISPARIIYGNNIDLDRSLFKEHATVKEQDISDYMLDLIDSQSRIIAIAQESQRLANEKHIRKNTKDMETTFPIGSYVLEGHLDKTHFDRPDKLASLYKGPFRIVSNDANQRYTLQSLLDMSLHVVHAKHLQPFEYDPAFVNPVDIARHANGEFVIDKIIDIRGNRNKWKRYLRTDLELLVRWSGYDESNDSWEPYKEIRKTEKFIDFCNQNELKYLIPPNIEP
jgi:hypothetical protein